MRKLSTILATLVILISIVVPASAYDLSLSIDFGQDREWARSGFYDICKEMSGKTIKSVDNIFDCDDWAVIYLMYKKEASYGHADERSVVVIFHTKSDEGHAMSLFRGIEGYVLCDPQRNVTATSRDINEVLTAAIGIWIHFYNLGDKNPQNYSVELYPLYDVVMKWY